MTRRPTILVDCDGVLADFVEATLDAIQDETGKRFSFKEINQFDIGRALGLEPDEVKKMVARICTESFCRDLAAFEGAREGLDALREIGNVYCVTSPFRSPFWMYERQMWLEEQMGFTKANTFHTSAKYLVRGDYLVDDKLDTLVEWEKRNPGGHGVLVKAPWNQPTADRSYSVEVAPNKFELPWRGLETAAGEPGRHQWQDIVLLIRSAEAVKQMMTTYNAL